MQVLEDVEKALEFCKESEVWVVEISYSLDKPTFIIVLLHNLGTHIDPRVLVERIEPGLEIHGPRWLDTDLERLQPAEGLQEDPGV